MLAIYMHHIAKGVDPDALARYRGARRRGHQAAPQVDAPAQAAAYRRGSRTGVVLGYAYAVPFRKRPAYRYTVKHSIYVHNDHLRKGVGRKLMTALIDACAAAGFRQMIGYIDAANKASLAHPRALRLPAGRLPAAGRLQVRPLDRQRDGAALAGPRRHGAAGPLRRRWRGTCFAQAASRHEEEPPCPIWKRSSPRSPTPCASAAIAARSRPIFPNSPASTPGVRHRGRRAPRAGSRRPATAISRSPSRASQKCSR